MSPSMFLWWVAAEKKKTNHQL